MVGRKGQGELVEYVITFLISTTVIIIVYTLVVAIYNQQIKGEIYDELKQLEVQTVNSIIKLYDSSYGYSETIPDNSAVLLGTINLNYPSQVARRNYEIMLVSPNQIYTTVNVSTNFSYSGGQTYSGSKIIGRTTQSPVVEVTTNIPNLDVVFQGVVSSGVLSTLSFYKANLNGTAKNVVTIGNASMLAFPFGGQLIVQGVVITNISFEVTDNLGNDVAIFDNWGNITLKGTCSYLASCGSPPALSPLLIQNSTGSTVSYIDNSGNLCIQDANCNDKDANCNNPGDGSFIIQNSTQNVAYINATGNLCLVGTLSQNALP